LTPRQTQILIGIAAGKTNKHLARELGITERTVKHHLTAVFDRLGTSRRSEAVSLAMSQGLLVAHTRVSLQSNTLRAKEK
jgi:DNA-binding NarL/FixJ family response regulator